MIEKWKYIPDYENHYLISSYGQVKSVKNWKSKSFQIHQLVAINFLNHIPNGLNMVVNHIDLDKHNNITNLEVITNRENSNRKHLKSTSIYTGVSWFNHLASISKDLAEIEERLEK